MRVVPAPQGSWSECVSWTVASGGSSRAYHRPSAAGLSTAVERRDLGLPSHAGGWRVSPRRDLRAAQPARRCWSCGFAGPGGSVHSGAVRCVRWPMISARRAAAYRACRVDELRLPGEAGHRPRGPRPWTSSSSRCSRSPRWPGSCVGSRSQDLRYVMPGLARRSCSRAVRGRHFSSEGRLQHASKLRHPARRALTATGTPPASRRSCVVIPQPPPARSAGTAAGHLGLRPNPFAS